MKRILLAFSILLMASLQLAAQTTPPSNLSGDELKSWLRTNWYDGKRVVLSYSTARGKMYNYIDNYDNKVTCVYSGYQESKTYSETNTSTSMANINCEHTVPQSWFSEVEVMRSDIHHLFPTFMQWNSDRGSDPFAEIPDNQTTKWIRGTSSQSAIPTTNIAEYSEDNSSAFEPREDHKGNVARAVFYFYTMYPTQAGNITRAANLNTLYEWHKQDPVDDRERERNRRTAVAQGNLNPYIDYPELVAKAWGFAPANCSPATQLSNLAVSQQTPTSLTLTWANGTGDRRLIVMKAGSIVDFTPTGTYSGINSDYSAATDQGNGHHVVYYNNGNSVTITALKANTTYTLQAFEACATDNTYNTNNAPTITVTTPDYACTGVPAEVTALTTANITQNGFTLNWANGSGDGRVVLIRKDEVPAFIPEEGTAYTSATANYTLATALTDGSRLIYSGDGSKVDITGLQAGSLYFAQVYEVCTNGYLYAATAPAIAISTAAANNPPTGNGNVIAMQDFNGTANDGWVVTSDFSSSTDNTGYPAGQRLRSGASLQVSKTTKNVVFTDVDVVGKQDVYFELYNSSVATTSGNGIENTDWFEVYIAVDGADFSATPDIRLTGNATDNNIRYGMEGTGTITTAAGTPVEKIYTEKSDFANENAPSILRVTIPNGTSTVKAKLVINTNNDKEYWNVDDVALYSAAASADCDELTLEGHAGNDITIYTGQAATIGAAAEAGYTYSWSPAVGLNDATLANPTVSHTTPGTYVYTVTATKDGCTSTDEITVTVETLAAPVVADVTVCVGQSTTLEVSAPDVKMEYKWYDHNGIALARGNIYTTSPLTETTDYYVEAISLDGTVSTRTKVIVTVLSGAPTTPVIEGNKALCAGETTTYTVAAQEGVTTYTWTLPQGWTIVQGAGTETITLQAGNISGEIHVTAANSCATSGAATLAVTVEAALSNNIIQGAQTICAGQAPVTITGTQPAGGNGTYMYEWQSSADGINFIPVSGDASTRNFIPGPLPETTYLRRIVASGSCGQSISNTVKITVQALPATPAITQDANQLTASVAGAAYEWFFNGKVIEGATTQTITITENGDYAVRIKNEVGCYSDFSVKFGATMKPTAIGDELGAGISVAPNPAPGKFSLYTEEPLTQVQVYITNPMGSVIYKTTLPLLKDKLEVNLSHLPAGLYLVQLQTDKLRITRKVILTK